MFKIPNNSTQVATNTASLADLTDDGTITERVVLTQAEYDALVTAGTTVATTEYVIVG